MTNAVRDLVIVANRLPVRRVTTADGSVWERSPGGLVTALEPAAVAARTSWIGWTGEAGPVEPPFAQGGLTLHPLCLPDHLVDAFYNGFSNGTLWPLYHDAILVPQFHDHWWDAYVAVNERYAEAAAAVAPPAATVWIHDYQLQLVPQMLRDLRPDVRIGFFLHIPFPAQELFLRIPWRAELTRGILGADVVGFQTVVGAQNFRQIARRLLGDRWTGKHVAHAGRQCLVDTFPVGIDAAKVSRLAADPATTARAAKIRAELGSPRTVLLGVDRLDYTKGIEVRLRAYRELLEEGRIDPQEAVLVQIAQPSRDAVPGYTEIRTLVEQMTGSINGDFGRLGGVAVEYLHQSQPFAELVALYRAADVMLVTPFRDGMNLVAKEYVASRVDNTGALVLSEFAGAAHQLTDAVTVNPFDVKAMKDAIESAVHGDPTRQRRAMQALRRRVHEHDAAGWAADFLDALDRAA
jgi:trehalose 6-phosphate synthase